MTDEFINNTAQNRFELHTQGAIVFANYRLRGKGVSIDHVEAPVELRGTGAAGKLMQHIMAHAKQESWSVSPLCGYAVAWLQRHPEFNDLLA